MNPNFVIFLVITSILTMAVYSSSTNFVSAENCYTSGEKRVCITTFNSPMPSQSNRDILPPSTGLPIDNKSILRDLTQQDMAEIVKRMKNQSTLG